MPSRLSADIGGTFTDAVRLDIETGDWVTGKVPTTADNVAVGLLQSFDLLTGGDYSDVVDIVHGTTSGLNALIERRGVNTAVVTTAGFRDVYEIGRGNHTEMYNTRFRKPRPLVARKDIHEVGERVRFDGSIERALDLDEVSCLLERLSGSYDSIAVGLINSISNPAHERAIKQAAVEAGFGPHTITLSSDVSAEGQEYERFSTTILSAYIAPIMDRYLTSLEESLRERGFTGRLRIMSSSGGLISFTAARAEAARTLMSGPVGGVIGAAQFGSLRAEVDLITVDMGGTSFDVSMISDGEMNITTETTVAGVPIATPTVNTISIGAGGGSIAWTEADGMRVGPQSAGANPGPISYGRGGELPTVTDANIVVGNIDPDNFLGGRMRLCAADAEAAFDRYAAVHHLGAPGAAEGVLEIVNSAMANAIREISLWQGKDVADYVLVAYGGAGPLHTALIAEELEITKVVVPRDPGAFSAWGMLYANLSYDTAASVVQNVDEYPAGDYRRLVADLEEQLRAKLAADGGDLSAVSFRHLLDLRYLGQKYSITVPFEDAYDPAAIFEAYHDKYLALYGFNNQDTKVQLVNVRVIAVVEEPHKPVARLDGVDGTADPLLRHIPSYDGGKVQETAVYTRDALAQGAPVAGPAVIVEFTSTIHVPSGWQAEAGGFGEIVLSRTGK